MASTVIRNLALNFVARTTGLAKGIKSAEAIVSGFVRKMSVVAGLTTAALGALGLTLSAGKAAAMVKTQFGVVDALAKTSDQLGIATEDLAAFQLQGELAGVGAAEFSNGVAKMIRSIADASQGSKEAMLAFSALGLDPGALQAKSTTEAYLEIADAIAGVTNAQQRLDLATQIFGRGGVRLISMLAEGRKGFDSASREARAFGLAISRSEAAGIERANDAITRMHKSLEGAARVLAVSIAPIVEKIANEFVRWATENDRLVKGLKNLSSAVGGELARWGALGDLEKRHQQLLDERAILKDWLKVQQSALEFSKSGRTGAVFTDTEGNVLGAKEIEDLITRQKKALEENSLAINKIRDEMSKSTEGQSALKAFAREAERPTQPTTTAARSLQGPRGLLRGSSEAAAAEARFLNRVGSTPELQEQRKANQYLQSIDTNIKDIRRRQASSEVSID